MGCWNHWQKMKSDLKEEMKKMSVDMLESIQSDKESRVEVEG